MNTRPINSPLVATDTLIFTVRENQLAVLLIKIKSGPYRDKWALPGGLVNEKESLDEATDRVLRERAGVSDIYLEQLYTFGDPKRDRRQRSVSVAYFALVNNDQCTPQLTEYISDVRWHSIKKIPTLAFDHNEILTYGLERLRSKLAYTNIAYGLLPRKFTLSELQTIYEAILGKSLDRRNFRKKIQALGLVKGIGEKRQQGVSRPAQLFTFAKQKPQIINVL